MSFQVKLNKRSRQSRQRQRLRLKHIINYIQIETSSLGHERDTQRISVIVDHAAKFPSNTKKASNNYDDVRGEALLKRVNN